MKLNPTEATWTQVNKSQLRPGDIVRFSYAVDATNPIVGKVAAVSHKTGIIYFEQQPEELQAFSRTAAAPITFDPDEVIEVLARTRTRWTFSRDKWAEDLDAFGFDPSKRKWPSNLDGCVVWFDSDEDVVGTAYDEYGTSFGIHREWCIAEEVGDVGI